MNTAPDTKAKSESLSDADIAQIWRNWPVLSITSAPKAISFARAILAADERRLTAEQCGAIRHLPPFEDPSVQRVYEMLCDSDTAPPPGEHWEGWIARRIVAALTTQPQAEPQDHCSATGWGHRFGAHGPNGAIQCEFCGEAQPQAEDIRAKLQDPVAVHVALMRGEIARPPIRDMLHAYGAEALARWDAAQPQAIIDSAVIPPRECSITEGPRDRDRQTAQPQAESAGGCKVVGGTPCNSPTVCAAYGCTHDSKAQPQAAEPAELNAAVDMMLAHIASSADDCLWAYREREIDRLKEELDSIKRAVELIRKALATAPTEPT